MEDKRMRLGSGFLGLFLFVLLFKHGHGLTRTTYFEPDVVRPGEKGSFTCAIMDSSMKDDAEVTVYYKSNAPLKIVFKNQTENEVIVVTENVTLEVGDRYTCMMEGAGGYKQNVFFPQENKTLYWVLVNYRPRVSYPDRAESSELDCITDEKIDEPDKTGNVRTYFSRITDTGTGTPGIENTYFRNYIGKVSTASESPTSIYSRLPSSSRILTYGEAFGLTLNFDKSQETDRVGVFGCRSFVKDRMVRLSTIKNAKFAKVLPVDVNLRANLGEEVVLKVESETPFGLTWLHNGSEFVDHCKNQTECVLSYVTKRDSGIYECYLDSEERESGHQALMKLTVRGCPKHYFNSPKCDKLCPQCLNGGVCDDITGKCICPPEFYGPLGICENSCNQYKFGKSCGLRCKVSKNTNNLCIGTELCLPDPFGCTCARGLRGPDCTRFCPTNTFGAGCTEKCHCSRDGCSPRNGNCYSGKCADGYFGFNCQFYNPKIPFFSHDIVPQGELSRWTCVVRSTPMVTNIRIVRTSKPYTRKALIIEEFIKDPDVSQVTAITGKYLLQPGEVYTCMSYGIEKFGFPNTLRTQTVVTPKNDGNLYWTLIAWPNLASNLGNQKKYWGRLYCLTDDTSIMKNKMYHQYDTIRMIFGRVSDTGTGLPGTGMTYHGKAIGLSQRREYSEETDNNMAHGGSGLPLDVSVYNYKYKIGHVLEMTHSFDVGRIGVFSCQAMTDHSYTTLKVIRMYYYAPIFPRKYYTRINLGESTILRVDLRWRHKIIDKKDLRWSFNGSPLELCDRQNWCLINRATELNAGIYECYENGFRHEGKHAIMRLIVRGCPSGFWNPPVCDKICTWCVNSGVCDEKNGNCICGPGYRGEHCEIVCPPKTYGLKCGLTTIAEESIAGQYEMICLPDPYGCSCMAGMYSDTCYRECPDHKFGPSCELDCNCESYLTGVCDKYTGKCPAGTPCTFGWHGSSCQLRRSEVTHLSHSKVNPGEYGQLTCLVSAYPVPFEIQIVIYKTNEYPIKFLESEYTINVEDRSVTLRSKKVIINAGDEFKCLVSNDAESGGTSRTIKAVFPLKENEFQAYQVFGRSRFGDPFQQVKAVTVCRTNDISEDSLERVEFGRTAYTGTAEPGLSLLGHRDVKSSDVNYNLRFYSAVTPHESAGLPKARYYNDDKLGQAMRLMEVDNSAKRIGVFYCKMLTQDAESIVHMIYQSDKGPLRPLKITVIANIGEDVKIETVMKVIIPELGLNWLHNERPLPQCYNGTIQYNQDHQVNTSSCVIPSVKMADAGIYESFYESHREIGIQAITRLIVRACPNQKWNPPHCQSICNDCLNGGICLDHNGKCQCPPGYYGTQCEQVCENNHSGKDCQLEMFSCKSTSSGICLRDQVVCTNDPYGCSCGPGLYGENCDKECPSGKFGNDCLQTCHCETAQDAFGREIVGACHPQSGACVSGRCDTGWSGPTCQFKPAEIIYFRHNKVSRSGDGYGNTTIMCVISVHPRPLDQQFFLYKGKTRINEDQVHIDIYPEHYQIILSAFVNVEENEEVNCEITGSLAGSVTKTLSIYFANDDGNLRPSVLVQPAVVDPSSRADLVVYCSSSYLTANLISLLKFHRELSTGGQHPGTGAIGPDGYDISSKLDTELIEDGIRVHPGSGLPEGAIIANSRAIVGHELIALGANNISWTDYFGVFSCEVTSVSNEMTTLEFILMNKNAVIKPLRKTLTVSLQEEATATLQMYAVNGTSGLRWLHNGDPIPGCDDQGDCLLTEITGEDAGMYECFYDGQYSQGRHGIMQLIVRACPAQKWGLPECNQQCMHCANGGHCHEKTGKCVCPPGLWGDHCESVCAASHYGSDCGYTCDVGDCGGMMICERHPYGCSCGAGYHGFDCSSECGPGRFGPDCSLSCHCKIGECDRFTGECPGGCDDGWFGPNCFLMKPRIESFKPRATVFGAKTDVVCVINASPLPFPNEIEMKLIQESQKIIEVAKRDLEVSQDTVLNHEYEIDDARQLVVATIKGVTVYPGDTFTCSVKDAMSGSVSNVTDAVFFVPPILKDPPFVTNGDVGKYEVKIHWKYWNESYDHGTGPVEQYSIHYKAFWETDYYFVAEVKPDVNSYTITGLTPYVKYDFSIKAKKYRIDWGDYCEPLTATTLCESHTHSLLVAVVEPGQLTDSESAEVANLHCQKDRICRTQLDAFVFGRSTFTGTLSTGSMGSRGPDLNRQLNESLPVVTSDDSGFPSGSIIENSEFLIGQTLKMLPNAAKNRIGVYYCSEPEPSTQLTHAILATKNAAVRSKSPTVTASIGESVTLEMIVTGFIEPSALTWIHEGVFVSSCRGQSSCTIKSVQVANAGIYECYHGDDRSKGNQGIVRLIVRECPAGKWSLPNCELHCPVCLNGGVCSTTTGNCICAPGFRGLQCEETCNAHMYGSECGLFCPHEGGCRGKLFCLPDPYGCSCYSGFYQSDCMESCPTGYFGPDCKHQCYCSGSNLECNAFTGACESGKCAKGVMGKYCQFKKSEIMMFSYEETSEGHDETQSSHNIVLTCVIKAHPSPPKEYIGIVKELGENTTAHIEIATFEPYGDNQVTITTVPVSVKAGNKFNCDVSESSLTGQTTKSLVTYFPRKFDHLFIMSKSPQFDQERGLTVKCVTDTVFDSPDHMQWLTLKRAYETGTGSMGMGMQGPSLSDKLASSTSNFGSGLPNFVMIQNSMQQTGQEIYFHPSGGLDNLGIFQCEMLTKTTSTRVNFPVTASEAPVKPLRATITANIKETVVLRMNTVRDPMGLLWLHNGDPFSCDDQTVKSECILASVSVADSGIYECFYSGDRELALQGITRLIVRGCPPGYWGENCEQICDWCGNGGVCDDQSGTCACPVGFTGRHCEEICFNGEKCTQSCGGGGGSKCRGMFTCIRDPGGCACANGYHGDNCETDCPEGKYGPDCALDCHCQNVKCDQFTGKCVSAQCLDGWSGPNCQYILPSLQIHNDKIFYGENTTAMCTINSYPPPAKEEVTLAIGGRILKFDYKLFPSKHEVVLSTNIFMDQGDILNCMFDNPIIGNSSAAKPVTFFEPPFFLKYPHVNPIDVGSTYAVVRWLEWSECDGGGDGPVTNYRLNYQTKSQMSTIVKETKDTLMNLTDLLPNTDYECMLTVYSELTGWGKFSPALEFTTLCSVPPQVTDLHVNQSTAESIYIKWNSSFECPSTFEVWARITSQDMCVLDARPAMDLTTTEEMSFNLTDLQPFSQYQVFVKGVNNGGSGLEKPILATTTDGIPSGEIVVMEYSTEAGSLIFLWQEMDCGFRHGKITGYEYELKSGDYLLSSEQVVATESMRVEFIALDSSIAHSFRVRALTSAGAGPFTEPISKIPNGEDKLDEEGKIGKLLSDKNDNSEVIVVATTVTIACGFVLLYLVMKFINKKKVVEKKKKEKE